jgi:hypothetical protein
MTCIFLFFYYVHLATIHIYLLICYISFPLSSLCFFQAFVLMQKGNLMELVDSKLGSEFNEEAVRMIKVALLCTNSSPALRPAMSAVVSMLEGRTAVNELITDPSIFGEELRFKAFRHPFDVISEADSLIQSLDST